MRSVKFSLCYAIVGVCVWTASSALAVTVDFESFADGQNINGVNLGGVTLTAPAGSVEVFDNRFGVSFHSATKAVGNFVTGANQSNPLIGTFDFPVKSVSLWGGDAGNDTDSWELRVYDAAVGGNLLGTAATGSWNGNPYRQLALSAANIWRFEATATGAVGYDDLEFSRVPEPTTVTLVFSMLGLASTLRRPRKELC